MKKVILLVALALAVLSAASTASADKRATMQRVDKAIAGYFNNSKLRAKYASEIRRNNRDGSYTLSHNGRTMRFLMEKKGKPDKHGKYPLYIALHGGGGAPSAVNDEQWEQMFSYYKDSVKNGIYIACRGISDTWDLHFQRDSYPLYDRLIQDMIYLHDVDPNRVYLLGFSAGGDGVYQIAPRMADRFAAANMSSGHPNGVSLVNLFNCPLSIQVGIRDYYSRSGMRSVRGAEFEKLFATYSDHYGLDYKHRVLVHVPAGHNYVDNEVSCQSYVLKDPAKFAEKGGEMLDEFISVLARHEDLSGYDDGGKISVLSYAFMGDDDFNSDIMRAVTEKFGIQTVCPDAVTYLSQFKREPLPDKIVWDLGTRADSRETDSFYWLQADRAVNKGLIIASVNRKTNTITVTPDKDVNGDFSILVSPYMIDVSKPVHIVTPEGTASGTVEPSQKVIEESLRDRGDPNHVFAAKIRYNELKGKTSL